MMALTVNVQCMNSISGLYSMRRVHERYATLALFLYALLKVSGVKIILSQPSIQGHAMKSKIQSKDKHNDQSRCPFALAY